MEFLNFDNSTLSFYSIKRSNKKESQDLENKKRKEKKENCISCPLCLLFSFELLAPERKTKSKEEEREKSRKRDRIFLNTSFVSFSLLTS